MAMILGALAIGLTLGLLGSGGSILTVPVLVYVLGHDDKVAIAESLGIVGAIALTGMLPYARTRQVDWRSVALFGLPGMAGTYGGAWLGEYVPGPVQLVLFAVVMLFAAGVMLRKQAATSEHCDTLSGESRPSHAFWLVALEGLAVGILTGLVGVGGGFLIVPALVLLGGLPMRLAVGTSLVIIALKSFSGFFKYLSVLNELGNSIDWETMAWFSTIGIAGTLAGSWLSNQINQAKLRRAFAVFLLVMGVVVLGREVPHALELQESAPPEAASALQQSETHPTVNLPCSINESTLGVW